jgi:ABC-2 type transport system permease protein
MIATFATQVRWLGLRSLRRFYRIPANPFSIIFFPLLQLLIFSQLYKDIVQLPGFGGEVSYLAYLAPGQIAFAAFFATAWGGANLLVDMRTGFLDKLRVAPIHRMAILAGELVTLFLESAAMAAVMLVVSVVLGAGVVTGLPGAFVIVLLAGAFGVAWAGTSLLPALLTRNEQATGMLSFLFFPLAFTSTAFVPPALMPEWLQLINNVNPISYAIEAMRTLMVDGFDWAVIGRAVLAIIALGVILQAATLWAFRRLTT